MLGATADGFIGCLQKFAINRYTCLLDFIWRHTSNAHNVGRPRNVVSSLSGSFRLSKLRKNYWQSGSQEQHFYFLLKTSQTMMLHRCRFTTISLSLSLFLVSRSHLLTHLPTSSKFFVGPWLGRNGRCSSLTSGRTCVRIPHHID